LVMFRVPDQTLHPYPVNKRIWGIFRFLGRKLIQKAGKL
jgi:hypothetical protein